MTPSAKVQNIRLFLQQLYIFSQSHPEILDDLKYFFINLPTTTKVTPFHRMDEDDPGILKLFDRYKSTLLKRLYLADWEFVKLISYQQFFVEHLNMVDIHYQTYYNILGNDVLYTEMYVPRILKKFECQRHLYLRK